MFWRENSISILRSKCKLLKLWTVWNKDGYMQTRATVHDKVRRESAFNGRGV